MPLWWCIFLWELVSYNTSAYWPGIQWISICKIVLDTWCLKFENVGDQMFVPNAGMPLSFQCKCKEDIGHRIHEWLSKSVLY
jgi:hypothetical protein